MNLFRYFYELCNISYKMQHVTSLYVYIAGAQIDVRLREIDIVGEPYRVVGTRFSASVRAGVVEQSGGESWVAL